MGLLIKAGAVGAVAVAGAAAVTLVPKWRAKMLGALKLLTGASASVAGATEALRAYAGEPGGGPIPLGSRQDPPPAEIVSFTEDGRPYQAVGRAKAALDAMRAAAVAGGVDPRDLVVVSAWRPAARQQQLWDQKVREVRAAHPGWSQNQIEEEADDWVARPGSSEHESGRTFDLRVGATIGKTNSSANGPALFATPAFRWLAANAARYGFYQTVRREAWHWTHAPRQQPAALA